MVLCGEQAEALAVCICMGCAVRLLKGLCAGAYDYGLFYGHGEWVRWVFGWVEVFVVGFCCWMTGALQPMGYMGA